MSFCVLCLVCSISYVAFFWLQNLPFEAALHASSHVMAAPAFDDELSLVCFLGIIALRFSSSRRLLILMFGDWIWSISDPEIVVFAAVFRKSCDPSQLLDRDLLLNGEHFVWQTTAWSLATDLARQELEPPRKKSRTVLVAFFPLVCPHAKWF